MVPIAHRMPPLDREQVMPYPIRQTAFTWDPDTESRSEAWSRVKHHAQQELDRIHAAAVLERRLVRRQASPHYARNRQIVQASRQGVSDRDIGRAHGVRAASVREILRSEQRWYGRDDPLYATLRDEHPARHGTALELQQVRAVTSQTRKLLTDP